MKICDIRTTTVSVSLPFRIFDAVDLYPHLRDLTDEPVLDESSDPNARTSILVD